MLDADELLARLVDCAQELVELGLHRRTVAVLAVLDQEYHQEGDDRRSGVDDQLPRIGIMEDGPGRRPDEDHADGEAEGQRMTGPGGGSCRAPVEETPHAPTNARAIALVPSWLFSPSGAPRRGDCRRWAASLRAVLRGRRTPQQ